MPCTELLLAAAAAAAAAAVTAAALTVASRPLAVLFPLVAEEAVLLLPNV